MKQMTKRIVSLLLAVLLIIPCGVIFASADEGTPFTYIKGANGASSAYQASKFYANLHKLTITGDQRTNLVAVALTQAGYFESNSTAGFGGSTPGTKNFCEYNYNMGDFGSGYGDGSAGQYHWCASFVSWCILQSQVYTIKKSSMGDWCRSNKTNMAYVWREVSCNQWTDQLERAGYFKKSKNQGGSYTPLTGDLIFFTYNQTSAGHIGIVVYTDGTYVYTVEGNTNDQNGLETNGNCVAVKKYTLNSSYIFGYGAMPYKEDADAKIDFSGKNKTTGLYMNTDANKYMYEDENCSATKLGIINRFTIFDVTQVCSNGNLKVTAVLSDGTTKTGYIDPAASKVYQLTSTATTTEEIAVSNNVAAGKSYTTSLLYRQGDASNSWGYVATNPINYDDENGKSLTDGIISNTVNYEHDAWAGLHYNTPDAAAKGYSWVNVNLADVYDVTQCMLYVPATDLGGGVNVPVRVSFWGSEDGTNYKELGDATITAVNDGTAVAKLSCNKRAQYIEARIFHGGWNFVSEIAVVGTVASDIPPEVSEDEDSSDVVEDSSDVVEDSSDVVEDSSDVIEESSDVIEDSSEEVEDSSDVVEDSSEEESSEVIEDSSDVTEDSEDNSDIEEEPEIPVYDVDFVINGNGSLEIFDKDSVLLEEIENSQEQLNHKVSVSDMIKFKISPKENWKLMKVYINGIAVELGEYIAVDVAENTVIEITIAQIPETPDLSRVNTIFRLNADGKSFSATLTNIENAVYSFDGINYTADNFKLDCAPSTDYTVYVKIVDSETGLESEVATLDIAVPQLPYEIGDINQNGKIDMTDYILLKRAYFGTYTFDELEKQIGDINQNGKIDMTDYILLKRIYFGTYKLK